MIIAPLYVLINLEDSQCKIGRFLWFIVKKGQNTLRMTIQHDAVCHGWEHMLLLHLRLLKLLCCVV